MRPSRYIGAGIAASAASLAIASNPMGVPGAGFTIPDNSPAGGASVVVVPANTMVVGVAAHLQHTWVGDLVMTLEGGANGSVTLIDRPGVPGTSFGNSADFVGANLYTWTDGGAPFPQSGGGVVPTGTYAPEPGQMFASLGTSAGPWTLRIADIASGDVGVVHDWTLIVKAVPSPGAPALLGLGALLLRRRRA